MINLGNTHTQANWVPLLLALGLPEPEKEYRFHAERKWRFDYAWPRPQVALEVEGGVWTGGAHVRGQHFESDCEKYNAAAALGWLVFRATPQMMNRGGVMRLIETALQARQP